MVVTTELFGQRHSDSRGTRTFKVTGTDVAATAKTQVKTDAPTTWDTLERDTGSIEVEEVGNGLWIAIVPYKSPGLLPFGQLAVGESRFAFDTRGAQQHIINSRSTVNKYAPVAKTAPNFKQLIGVTKDGVEGVDIIVPQYTFQETHVLSSGAVTDAYKNTLFALTGQMNDGTFRNLDAHECLFFGAFGTTRGDGAWEITYNFGASENITNLTIGDITGIAKDGWDYLWVYYQEEEDAAANAIVKVPVSVNVERVYQEGDFAGLGI